MSKQRKEHDSLGEVDVPEDRLWGAQTQRALHNFSIGSDPMPKELITAYAILKKAAATVNCAHTRLPKEKADLITTICDEIIAGTHDDQFPLGVWMTGSGTQFNMNINEVIANRASQITGKPLGSKSPIHPNDDVNHAQSSNDTFPTAMHIAAAIGTKHRLLPAIKRLRDTIQTKVKAWKEIVKLGRTHLQDATPLTLGQEFSGFVSMLDENMHRLDDALLDVYQLTIGGTAVGTGINAYAKFDTDVTQAIANHTELPFVPAENKFAMQGSHDALVHLSATCKTTATSLYKIANDIRLLGCGPRAGIYELILPANEPGSSIMPGKVNPTQCEALAMVAAQVMANDMAVTLGGAGGHLQMNAYKPLIIHNLMHSIRILADSCDRFETHLMKGLEPNKAQIASHLSRSLMLVTALSPAIGYDKASQIAHHAFDKNLSLREAALELKYISGEEFDRLIDPLKMCHPLTS